MCLYWHIPSVLYTVERIVGNTWVQIPLPVPNFNITGISNEKINQIIELRKSGKTYKKIQEITGCCKNTCIKYLKEAGIY